MLPLLTFLFGPLLCFLSLPINLSSSTRNVVTSSLEAFQNFSTLSSPARYRAAVLSSTALMCLLFLLQKPGRATCTVCVCCDANTFHCLTRHIKENTPFVMRSPSYCLGCRYILQCVLPILL